MDKHGGDYRLIRLAIMPIVIALVCIAIACVSSLRCEEPKTQPPSRITSKEDTVPNKEGDEKEELAALSSIPSLNHYSIKQIDTKEIMDKAYAQGYDDLYGYSVSPNGKYIAFDFEASKLHRHQPLIYSVDDKKSYFIKPPEKISNIEIDWTMLDLAWDIMNPESIYVTYFRTPDNQGNKGVNQLWKMHIDGSHSSRISAPQEDIGNIRTLPAGIWE